MMIQSGHSFKFFDFDRFHLTGVHDQIAMFPLADDIVDTDDVLFVGILRVADDGGACLYPCVAAVFVHETVVVCQHLAFTDHWE